MSKYHNERHKYHWINNEIWYEKEDNVDLIFLKKDENYEIEAKKKENPRLSNAFEIVLVL